MPAAISQRAFTASRIVHWLGCLLGSAIAFGGKEEPPPVSPATVALGVMVFGYLLAWWRDWLGAFINLTAFVAFYGWTFASTVGRCFRCVLCRGCCVCLRCGCDDVICGANRGLAPVG